MVRSTSSCFKIITCGSDSVDEDDIQRTESKGSTDKRQWSFRKRSPRHRVLSNTMISETPSNGNKESIDFYPQNNPTVPEKISANPLPTAANSGVPDPLIATENDCKIGTFISTQRDSKIDSSTTLENASKINPNLKENVATVIQSAIRGYLACRVLLKLKNVVKLQAVVRGHLVRRQAVGTLRCIQAIVKMQALVRARRVEKALGDSVIKAKFDTKNEKNNQCVEPLGKEGPGTRPSAEKFLSNGFARQLLESTPKKEPIHIKCDPSRTDSAWKWLERWMSVSSSDVPQPQISPENGEAADLKSCIRDAAMPLESEENLITYDVDNFDFQFSFPISSISDDDMKETRLEDLSLSKPRETSSNINVNQTEMQLSASPQTLLDSVSNDIEADKEQQKNTIKKAPNEQLEIDGKKFMFVPRKSCSPAFVAVQSKFEELSFAASSRKPIGSHQDEAELKLNTLSHPSDSLTTTKELSLTENLITYDPRFHLGGSECGTELSISSTLDSPDRSEVAFGELEDESKVVENASNIGNLHVDAKNNSSTSHPNSPYSVSVQQEQLEYVDGEAVDSDVVVDTTTNGQAHAPAPSPEASPQSHITAPESHGTPSSQTSVKAKRNKLNKSGQNRKSQSAGKESSLNRNHDSVVRHSIEQLPKDAKNGMRRNSFGSARSDHLDQEPRDSFSNSIPSYMQATESARAKANASNSPRSSPDLQDKEIYVKKRHSLPNANGKQGSSRKQPSISQVQHGASGKHTHSPREKWQR